VGASAAPALLLGLLNSGDPAVAGAAIAALNNLCAPGCPAAPKVSLFLLARKCPHVLALNHCRLRVNMTVYGF